MLINKIYNLNFIQLIDSQIWFIFELHSSNQVPKRFRFRIQKYNDEKQVNYSYFF